MNIYRFPTVSSELLVGESEDASSPLSSGLFRGIPSNEPVHVLVRIYVVKVSLYTVRPLVWKNPEMSGNLTAVGKCREIDTKVRDGKCQGKIWVA